MSLRRLILKITSILTVNVKNVKTQTVPCLNKMDDHHTGATVKICSIITLAKLTKFPGNECTADAPPLHSSCHIFGNCPGVRFVSSRALTFGTWPPAGLLYAPKSPLSMYQQRFSYKSSKPPPPFGSKCLWCEKEFDDINTLCKPNYCAELSQFRSLFLAMFRFKQGHFLPCEACNPITYHSSPKELLNHHKSKHKYDKETFRGIHCANCGEPFDCKHDLEKHLPFCACLPNENNPDRTKRFEERKRRAEEVYILLCRFGYKADSGHEDPNSKLPPLVKDDSDSEN